MQINVLMFNQDDPKKCTAAKLVRFGLAKKISVIHSRTILLHPFAAKILMNKENVTMVLVTHEEEIALKAKRIIKMKDGKIIKDHLLEANLC